MVQPGAAASEVFISPACSCNVLCLEQEQATLLVLTVTEWSRHLRALFACGQLKGQSDRLLFSFMI